MPKSIALLGAAIVMAVSTAAASHAQSSPFDPCMIEARAYCLALHSNDRLAYSYCVQEEYAACIGAVSAKPVDDDKLYLRRCKG